MSHDIGNYFAQMWRIERIDGVDILITDHDFDIEIDGEVYQASGALKSSEVERSVGFEAANSEFLGGLDGEVIRAEDLKAGLYQDAKVRHFIYDFENSKIEREIFSGQIVSIKFGENTFSAEVSNDLNKLDFVYGRRFNKECQVRFCSQECGLNENRFGVLTEILSATGTKINLEGREFFYPLDNGTVKFLNREKGVTRYAIRFAKWIDETIEIELWRKPHFEIKAGDSVQLYAGCNKSFNQCKETYNNVINFRGFPHMPGEKILNQQAGRDV